MRMMRRRGEEEGTVTTRCGPSLLQLVKMLIKCRTCLEYSGQPEPIADNPARSLSQFEPVSGDQNVPTAATWPPLMMMMMMIVMLMIVMLMITIMCFIR